MIAARPMKARNHHRPGLEYSPVEEENGIRSLLKPTTHTEAAAARGN